jgi:NAD(P)-dependent dehydrogenase (short-subunit alcohol dehydrogenase family)
VLTDVGLRDAVGLRGAVVIVTGGGSGIGAATARQLGTVGAQVVLVGRREALLKEVAAQIGADGGEALCVTADLADPASPRRIVDACLTRYGRIDGLVNNAAVVRHMPFMTGAVIPLDGGQVIDRE